MRLWAVFLWLLPPTGGEAAWVVEISEWVSEWVSETIEFWSWPNFDPMFPDATHNYCFFRCISLIRHSHSICIRYTVESSLFVISSLEPLALYIYRLYSSCPAVTLRKSIEDVNHLTINSGYCTRLKKKCFPFRNRCDRRIVKQSRFFFCEERAFYRLNQMPRSEDIIFQFLPWHY